MSHELSIDNRTVELYPYIQNQIENSRNFEHIKNDINKDIPRTYLVSDSETQKSQLARILLALAYVKPNIGYVQGLNFVAGILLKILLDEAEAFWVLLGIVKLWSLENMFVAGVPDLSLREHQIDYYFKTMIPDLHSHFRRINFTSGLFLSRLVLTIFASYLPYLTVIKVWDCVFVDNWKAIIKVICSILRELKPEFMHKGIEDISVYLRNHTREGHEHYQKLLRSARNFKISLRELKYIESDYYKLQNSFKISPNMPVQAIFSDFTSEDAELKADILKFQSKITKINEDFEEIEQNYLNLSMELLHIEKDITSLAEKRMVYQRIYKDMETKYQNSQTIVTKYMPDMFTKYFSYGFDYSQDIKIADMDFYNQKLQIADKELEDLKIQQREKVMTS